MCKTSILKDGHSDNGPQDDCDRRQSQLQCKQRDAAEREMCCQDAEKERPKETLFAALICKKRLCCHGRLATKLILTKRIAVCHETFVPPALEMGKVAKKNTRALPRGMLKNIRICLRFPRGTWHETLRHLAGQLNCSEC